MTLLDWKFVTADEWTPQQRSAIEMAVEKMVEFGAGSADAVFKNKDHQVVAGFSVCPVTPDMLAGVVFIDGEFVWATCRPDGGVFEPRTCRVCGCTDDDACFPPCSWVEVDLCSACAS